MRIFEILKIITKISDNKQDNLENYLSSINYISNLYRFKSKLSTVLNKDFKFTWKPTFKDCYLSEKLGIETITEENELRLFSLESERFLVDKTIVEEIKDALTDLCNTIICEENTITFYLK
jgi:hypothetical protein